MKIEKYSDGLIIKTIIVILFILLLLFSYGTIPESKLNNLIYQFFYSIKLPFKTLYILEHKLSFPPYFIYNFLLITAISIVFFMFYTKTDVKNNEFIKSDKSAKSNAIKKYNFLFNKKWLTYSILILLLYFTFLYFFITKRYFILQVILFITFVSMIAIFIFKLDKKNNVHPLNIGYPETNEIKILFLYVFCILTLYIFDLKSWKYSYIEDEMPFFDFVNGVLNDFTKINFFSGSGVYGYHPVLSSVWQKIIMFFTGNGIFGFKLSSAIIIPISIIPFYLWNKMVFNRTVATVSTIIFSFSNTMLGFSHIGYNNIQSIFFYVSVLCALEIAIRKRSFFWFFITALFMGPGFYTFYASRIIIIIFILYLLLHPERKQINKNHVIFSLIVFTLIILPILIEKDFIKNIIVQSVISGSEIKNQNERVIYIFMNFIHSFFAFLYKSKNTHYIIDGLVDIFSAIGIIFGLIWIIYNFKNDWRAKFLSLNYVILVFLIGGMQQYDYPVNTRLYFLVPLLATIGGIGIFKLSRLSYYFSKKNIINSIVLSIFCIIIISNNIYTFYIKMPEKFHFFQQAYLIKILQKYKDKQKILVMNNAGSFRRIIYFYGLENKIIYSDLNNFNYLLKEDKIKNSVVIFDRNAASNMPEIEKLVKPGHFLTDNLNGQTIFYIFDFTDDIEYYNKFYELWAAIKN